MPVHKHFTCLRATLAVSRQQQCALPEGKGADGNTVTTPTAVPLDKSDRQLLISNKAKLIGLGDAVHMISGLLAKPLGVEVWDLG